MMFLCCAHPGCGRAIRAKPYCKAHGRRAQIGADMDAPVRARPAAVDAATLDRIRDLAPGRTAQMIADIVGLHVVTVRRLMSDNGIPSGVRKSRSRPAREILEWMRRSAKFEAARRGQTALQPEGSQI